MEIVAVAEGPPSRILWLGALLIFALTAQSVADAGTAKQSTVVIERGANLPVCSAYVSQLERMATRNELNCGREEPQDSQRFTRQSRIQLSTAELYEISEQLFGFAEHSDSHYYDKWRENQLAYCQDSANRQMCDLFLKERRTTESAGGKWGEPVNRNYLRGSRAWRYESGVDIDNDGVRDAVLLWRREPCGAVNYKGVIVSSPTYAFVMDPAYRAVDEVKTRRVFGHPVSTWPTGIVSEKFRFVGDQFGLFVFDGRAYFDTFLTSLSDFENRRSGDELLSSRLGVFLHMSGATQQVCEILWKRPKK